MKLQQLLSYMRRAIDDYQMIDAGDVIAVGVSGGKDSLTLLYGLAYLRKFYPKQFEVKAITIDLGIGNLDLELVKQLCKELDVEYVIEKTDIGNIVFEERKESNPCSLCAKMRKGSLNRKIKEMGCNKVAYGHHKDDVVETMLLSMLFEGRFHTFSPVTYLDRMEVCVIRPLIYMSEGEVKGFTREYELPVAKSPCPAAGHTKREYVKNIANQLNHDNYGAKERMFRAILDGNIDGWSNRIERKNREQ